MFTGLVQDVGRLARLSRSGNDATFTIATHLPTADFSLGESIAIDGCCLTVTRFGDGSFDVDLSSETLRCTRLGDLRMGDEVHLERALRLGDRLGGHIVQGHVDGVGHLSRRHTDGAGLVLAVTAPAPLLPEMVQKGSITINGVSLTINALLADGFEVLLIPHTQNETRLAQLKVGDRVNLETDVIAKHVRRLAEPVLGASNGLEAKLRRNGYL